MFICIAHHHNKGYLKTLYIAWFNISIKNIKVYV